MYPQRGTQEDIFNELSTLIQSSMDGYNVCVFGYGQTGAGKTHTMIGTEGAGKGVLPRTIDLLFKKIEDLKRFGFKITIQVSFSEIYNERLMDLITEKQVSNDKSDFNLLTVEDKNAMKKYLELARAKRFTAKTDSNEVSSRSHAIYHIKITTVSPEKKKPKFTAGSITIIDLAGSERLNQSNTEGDRLAETKHINKSLTALRDVISAIANKEKHVPYRNSKLTTVLQSCLGNDSKILFIINISPCLSHFGQTLNSLRFGYLLKNCQLKKQDRNNSNMKEKRFGMQALLETSESHYGSALKNHQQHSGVKIANPVIERQMTRFHGLRQESGMKALAEKSNVSNHKPERPKMEEEKTPMKRTELTLPIVQEQENTNPPNLLLSPVFEL